MARRAGLLRGEIFDQLAAAYARVEPTEVGLIPCPLCLGERWERKQAVDGLLTAEHVPPKSVGGKRLVLTCHSCNSGAGATIDAAWSSSKRMADFGLQRPVKLRAILDIDGVQQRVTVDSGPDSLIVVGIPKAGHPDTPERMNLAIQRAVAADDPLRFNLRLEDRYFPREAKLSAMRAAYLLALQRLGWSYILDTAFDRIRQQVAVPSVDAITPTVVLNPSAPVEEPSLVVIDQPEELRSVAISFGQYLVFLPRPAESVDFFARIAPALSRAFTGGEVSFDGVAVEATAPPFLLDHYPEAVSRLLRRDPR